MIEFFQNYGVRLAESFIALVGLLCAIFSLWKAHKTKKICDKMLQDAKSRQTMVKCPVCKKESPLSDVTFRLPDGSPDNNLDGVPDDKE